MPTYEYECQECGHQFERFQLMSARPLTSCPKCKGKVKRLISGGAGIIFKGAGFYATDYRSPTYTQAAKRDRESAEPKKEKKESASPKPEK
jgi:putative FmdB family regulatory protein